ncbi:MAG: hypothetical protein WC495_06980 [Patescibacteria group bacterium]|jgi:hypothetical protein
MDGRITPDKVVSLGENEIFVFGSNRSGRHSKGAAKTAMYKFGAKWGQADGLQGRSYGIPTKDRNLNVLNIDEIEHYVRKFISVAKKNPQLTFLVTEIGCGLAKFSPKQIAPLFEKAKDVPNIHLPKRFWDQLTK